MLDDLTLEYSKASPTPLAPCLMTLPWNSKASPTPLAPCLMTLPWNTARPLPHLWLHA